MFFKSLYLIIFISVIKCEKSDSFHEELYLKILKNQQIYAYFQFTTIWNISLSDANSLKHYRLFPKSLGDVLDAFSVRELHFSLTQNHWRHEQWGYPQADASTGAEIWAWFRGHVKNVDANWLDLTNVLSGMFCASLNSVNSKVTVTPKAAMRPSGVVTKEYLRWQNNSIRYASLPRENVCTENLTPWSKLLPCGSKTGLASLLNSIKLYDASYHSLGLHFRPICRDKMCKSTAIELKQTISAVFDPIINIGYNSHSEYSLKMLFGRMLTSTCPLASTSNIYVDSSSDQISTLTPQPSDFIHFNHDAVNYKVASYNLPKFIASGRPFNLVVAKEKTKGRMIQKETVVTAHRFITGHGQKSGGITSLLRNNHPTLDMYVTYMEVVPWFLHVFVHTLKVENSVTNVTKPIWMHFVPGKDSLRPYHLELSIILPRSSTTKISFQFDRQLLKWTDYPPDPNHGFYVPPAVIAVDLKSATMDFVGNARGRSLIKELLESTTNSDEFLRIHTEALLVSLPTPDFSMPYNVICLVCTVVAIAFGSIHNLTTRVFVVYDPAKHRSLPGKLYARVKEKWAKWRGKNLETQPVVTTSTTSETEMKDNLGTSCEELSDNREI